MKNLLNFLLVLTIVLIISCQPSKTIDDNNNDSLDQQLTASSSIEDSLLNLLNYSDEFLEDLKDNKNNFVNHPFIDPADARRRLNIHKGFEGLRTPNYNAKKDIYGFTFSLENVESFLEIIRDYNNQVSNADSTIQAIRVYQSYRLQNGVPIEEVFMIPVIKSGANIYDIDDDINVNTDKLVTSLNLDNFDDPGMILDASVPCPNQCN